MIELGKFEKQYLARQRQEIMENQQQGNESNAHIVILDADGATIFNGRRTVRNITNDGITKSGTARVNGQEFDVVHKDWKWIGPMYCLGLNL